MAASLAGSKSGIPCQPARSRPLNSAVNPFGGFGSSVSARAAAPKKKAIAVKPDERKQRRQVRGMSVSFESRGNNGQARSVGATGMVIVRWTGGKQEAGGR